MRLLTTILMFALGFGNAGTAVSLAQPDTAVEQIVGRHIRALVPPDDVGGVAVAVRMSARTFYFNYGTADAARKRPISSESIFNLASVGKLFAATLLAQAVENGELSLDALAMNATALPLPHALTKRAVQGYGPHGRPIGQPGAAQGTFDWPGAGQIYSSPRDMAVFLTANLGELSDQHALQAAMAYAQQGVFAVNPRFSQGLAWQAIKGGNVTIVDKNGGLNNTSTYIGLVREQKLGIVILANRGRQPATSVGRYILHELAREKSEPPAEGVDPD